MGTGGISNFSQTAAGMSAADASSSSSSQVAALKTEALSLAASTGDVLTVAEQSKLRSDAWALMPTLSAPDQASLMVFLASVQAAAAPSGSKGTADVLMTSPPASNNFLNGPNITLIMEMLVQVMTKLGNIQSLALNKEEVQTMQAGLEGAQATASAQIASGNAQAASYTAQATAAQVAATAALAQFAVAVATTAITVGVQLGANTKTDDLMKSDPTGTFGKEGSQNATQYAAYQQARGQDLKSFDAIMGFMSNSAQSLSTYVTQTAQATSDTEQATQAQIKAGADAAVSLLQSLLQTLQKGTDTLHQAKDQSQMLDSVRNLARELYQTSSKFMGAA